MFQYDIAASTAAMYQNKLEMAGRLDARNVFEYIMQRIEEHQSVLQENEELGLKLANFGEASQIHIRGIGYKNPNLVEFTGVNPDGNTVTLIQNISQLNFMIVTLKAFEEKAFRIGFAVNEE